MKKIGMAVIVGVVVTISAAHAQSGTSTVGQSAKKNSGAKSGPSNGLQQSNKGGATSGGPSGGAGNIGQQRGSTTGASSTSGASQASDKTRRSGAKKTSNP